MNCRLSWWGGLVMMGKLKEVFGYGERKSFRGESLMEFDEVWRRNFEVDLKTIVLRLLLVDSVISSTDSFDIFSS
jgi:hypothetical protein